MESKKVSIIVPVYKVEKFLERCVESIIKQTYQNIEIILIDDESPDECPKMCDQYEIKDNRIKVIHKKNGGLSDARNAGLDIASGEYIAFVDSDDWIESDFIETLYMNAEREKADISVVGYQLIWEDGRIRRFSRDEEYYVFDRENAIRELLKQQKFQCMVCQKMYRKQIFETIRFPVGKIYEDVAIGLSTFLKAERVVVSGKVKYNYFQRSDSIVNAKFDKRKLFFLECCNKIIDYSDSQNKLFDLEAHTFYLRALMMFTLQLYQLDEEKYESTVKWLENEIRRCRRFIWKNPSIELKKKIVLSLICVQFPRRILVTLWSGGKK
ncbi:MAG: glycosyltransferase family 2 protein [Coprococcus sp.]